MIERFGEEPRAGGAQQLAVLGDARFGFGIGRDEVLRDTVHLVDFPIARRDRYGDGRRLACGRNNFHIDRSGRIAAKADKEGAVGGGRHAALADRNRGARRSRTDGKAALFKFAADGYVERRRRRGEEQRGETDKSHNSDP